MNKDFLSIIEFAAKLGLHPNTIRRMIHIHRINAMRIGKAKNSSFRIHISEINRIAQFDLEEVIEREVEKRLKERREHEKPI